MLAIFKVVLPVLEIVTVCAELACPTVILGKVSVLTENAIVGVPVGPEPELLLLLPPPQPVRRTRKEAKQKAKEQLRSIYVPSAGA